MNYKTNQFYLSYLLPKFWGIWLGVGILRLISFLPYQTKFKFGNLLGDILYKLATSRRNLAEANLKIAFPEKSEQERRNIAHAHFRSFATAIVEATFVWWGRHRKDQTNNEKENVTYIGLDNLKEAEAKGKGVLVLAPHFTHLDVTTLFVSFVTDLHPVYRPNDNPVLEYVMTKGRTISKHEQTHIHYHDTRTIVKALKKGYSLGYLPDQRYRGKGHIEVPFFNKLAKSHSATSKLAKMTGCAVVPTFTRRLENGKYEIYFLKALENFPSGDDYADTLRLHQLYEAEIRQNPSQYLWVHNRWDLEFDKQGHVVEKAN